MLICADHAASIWINALFIFLQEALAEKEKGNIAYKNKDFEAALQHYDKAIELDPTNVTFLTNKAGRLPLVWNSMACTVWKYEEPQALWGEQICECTP